MSDGMKRQPPSQIYLQWFDAQGESPPIHADTTWCQDRIENYDTEYTREDIVELLRAQAAVGNELYAAYQRLEADENEETEQALLDALDAYAAIAAGKGE